VQLGHILYPIMLLAAGCTAFYMFRLYFLVFEGEYRGGAAAAASAHGGHDDHGHAAHGHDDHGHGHDAHGHGHDDHGAGHGHGHGGHGTPHESPPAMTVVLAILALGSVLVGFLGMPNAFHEGLDFFGEWLSPVLPALSHEESAGGFVKGALIATVVSIGGIALAWALYGRGVSDKVKRFVAAVPGLYRTVFNKYYIDELYDFLVVRPLRATAFVLWKAFDAFVIDLIFVNGVGFIVSGFGKLSKYLQNGDLQRYIVAVLVGAAAFVYVATTWDAKSAAKFDVSINGRDVEVTAHGAGPTARRISYQIDWDGKGHYGPAQQTNTFRHSYDAPGKYEITVKAMDPRWDMDAHTSKTVKVQ
jgi:NADH-quinone oxidoreductase subunit L